MHAIENLQHMKLQLVCDTDLIESREDQANKTLVQHLVGGLCLDVHMGGEHSDVGVGVVPPNHACAHIALAGELLCCCCTS